MTDSLPHSGDGLGARRGDDAGVERPVEGLADEVTDATTSETTMMIRPWVDPLVDESGHDPRSRYVEHFWLGVLGPTATWLIRRLVSGLERHPDGYEVDLVITARAMGMSYSTRKSSPFAKALHRCTMFGLAHQTSDGLAIRRRVPPIAHRHLRRLPEPLQDEHAAWQQATVSLDELTRAHRLALAMVDAGDDVASVEHQLVALGVSSAVAADVADNTRQLNHQPLHQTVSDTG